MLDTRTYEKGRKASNQQIRELNLQRHSEAFLSPRLELHPISTDDCELDGELTFVIFILVQTCTDSKRAWNSVSCRLLG
jgi:hypothetical protein